MTKSKRIYVCTDGSYSDYAIEAIFSTKQLAEDACAACGWDNVEEWVVDEKAGAHKGKAYRCSIILASGDILQEWAYDSIVGSNQRSEKAQTHENPRNGKVVTSTSFVGAAHARKLAIEARQKILREVTDAER